MASQEKRFTLQVVIPMLHRLGFKRIRYVQGSDEHGRDLVFVDYDRFGLRINCAAQIKVGDLRGTQKGKIQNEIIPQLTEGFAEPYRDPSTGETLKINRMYLIVSGVFIGTAKDQIHTALASQSNIVALDRNTIDLYSDPIGVETLFGLTTSRDGNGHDIITGNATRNPRMPILQPGVRLSIAIDTGIEILEDLEIVRVNYNPLFNSQQVYLFVPLPSDMIQDKKGCSKLLQRLHKDLHQYLDASAESFVDLLTED